MQHLPHRSALHHLAPRNCFGIQIAAVEVFCGGQSGRQPAAMVPGFKPVAPTCDVAGTRAFTPALPLMRG
ncbi:hypothetical protein [Falsiroseomonas sp.]|uniref:hypothetical protein n=1 Tax=Falsiroseomonas sp. TaxID=2870721 RepID=UPI002735B8A4|nr:hypothetical protein [Falsiroseomonas sp.]